MKGERTKQYLRHLRRGRGGALYLILIKEQGLRACLLHAFLGKLPARQQILTPQAPEIGRLGAASAPGKLSGRQSKQALRVCLLGTLANMPGGGRFCPPEIGIAAYHSFRVQTTIQTCYKSAGSRFVCLINLTISFS